MMPGPHRPGITICTPRTGRPEAAYWCRCGTHNHATGTRQVLALIDQWADHCQACPHAPEPRRRLAAPKGSAAPIPAVNRHRSEPAASDGLWVT